MVAWHTHHLPTATKEEVEAGIRDDIAISPKSLYGAILPVALPPEGEDEVIGGIITISAEEPPAPNVGDTWIDTTGEASGGGGGGGIPEAPFDDQQYARKNATWAVVEAGGGGGDDLDTTPVAATGSTEARVVPDWLAGAPIFEFEDDAPVTPDHRGAWLHMMNAVGSLVQLPDDWLPGMAFGVRQMGTGPVQWQYIGGSTVQLPISKTGHSGISEQYEEIIFRVISNSDGNSAIWGVSGSTY
jgi:hypothetical protein